MRILFVSMEYPPETGGGGIGSWVASIGPGLVARGHEVHVLSCVHCQPRRDYIDQGVHIHRRGQLPAPLFYPFKLVSWPASVGRLRTAAAAYYWYRCLSRQYRFDVIEYPDWYGEGLFLSLLRRKGTVAHLHTPLPVIAKYADLLPTRDLLLASWLESVAVRHARCITAPSAEVIRELPQNWLGGRDVSVIPLALDWQQWSGASPVATTGRQVIFIGRVERRKMPEVLVQAMQRLAATLADAEATFVGRGDGDRDGLPYEQWLQRMAHTTSAHCRFLGQVPRPELPGIMAQARVAVSTSSFENFPVAVLEAMASGRPVVVTTTNGIAPLIREHQAGEVVPAGDPDALAAALRPYLEDAAYAAEVGRRAQALVREQLDPERIAALREEVYRKAVGEVGLVCLRTRPVTIVVLGKYRKVFWGFLKSSERFAEPIPKVLVRDGTAIPDPAGWTVIQGPETFSMAGNGNLGLRAAAADSDVLYCGDDVRFVEEDTVERLSDLAHRHPEIGILSPRLRGRGSRPQLNPSADIEYVRPADMWFPCVYIKREVLDRVGFLDERFNGYGSDDLDFCLRAEMAGYKLAVTRLAMVRHEHGGGGPTTFLKSLGKDAFRQQQVAAAGKLSAKWGVNWETLARCLETGDYSKLVPQARDGPECRRDQVQELLPLAATGGRLGDQT